MDDRRSKIVRNARVLVAGATRADALDLLIEEGRISAIGAPGMTAPADAELVDAADRLVIPGLVNAHTHAHGGLGKGAVGDRLPLELFLTGSGALNGSRTLEDKYLSAQLSAAEMVKKGCTAAYDLFVEYPGPSIEGIDAVARAYRDVGMRAVIAPMMSDRTLYQAYPGLIEALPESSREVARRAATAPYAESLRACRAILQHWPERRPDVVAPREKMPIVFEDRRVGQSKMSRKIFLEALTMVWKLKLSV